jgi:hypothetical protein
MVGAILIAAGPPCGEPLYAAAKARSPASAWFHTPSSRDPTLELPDAVIRTGAEVVVLVDPDREEPATLEVVRDLGARVVVWSIVENSRFSRPLARTMLARGRWISRAADAVAVTVTRRAALLRDRVGRSATVVARPRDPRALAEWDGALRALLLAIGPDPG